MSFRIHPRSKDPIARRLVVGAMREAYGQPVESRGPFPTQFILQPASNQSSTTDANATLHVVFDDNSRAVEFRNLNISDAFEVCFALFLMQVRTKWIWFPTELRPCFYVVGKDKPKLTWS